MILKLNDLFPELNIISFSFVNDPLIEFSVRVSKNFNFFTFFEFNLTKF